LANSRDGVLVAAEVGSGLQTLNLNDLVTTTRSPDQIDLVCRVVPGGDAADVQAQVTNASVIAVQAANAATTTTVGD
jgi:hypothetical protein